MNDFKDFGIQRESKAFQGDKIQINFILNQKIEIHDYKIGPSKYEKGNGKCLHLQIKVDGSFKVVFVGSVNLQEMISKVPKESFPFQVTIIKENLGYLFT